MNSITNDKSIEKRPFKKNYSEALPTPARLKRTVLRREKNERDRVLGKRRSSRGRPFQVEGPTAEKTGLVEVRAKGHGEDPAQMNEEIVIQLHKG